MAAADLHGVPQYPDINTIVNALREAKWQRKELQSKHLTLRETYLQQLATSLVLKASPYLEDQKHAERLLQRIKEAAKRIQKKERR
jgi:propanediol dehydratase small subunit